MTAERSNRIALRVGADHVRVDVDRHTAIRLSSPPNLGRHTDLSRCRRDAGRKCQSLADWSNQAPFSLRESQRPQNGIFGKWPNDEGSKWPTTRFASARLSLAHRLSSNFYCD
jgi:hypothetical protein